MLSFNHLVPASMRFILLTWIFSQTLCQRMDKGAPLVDSEAQISCFKCHFSNKSSIWLGDATSAGKKLDLLDGVILENCAKHRSFLQQCPRGVNKCVLTITEEKVREKPEDNDKDNGYIVVSQFCGHAEDVETGCRKYGLTVTRGMQVRCVCGGTGCNYKINMATIIGIHRGSVLLILAMLYV